MSLVAPVQLTIQGKNEFDERTLDALGVKLGGVTIDTIQVNVGLVCNLACHHCHVESSPSRTEQMSWETMTRVLEAAGKAQAGTLDITGGAPEMNPDFRRLVDAALGRGMGVTVRTNLTVLLQDGYDDLPQWYADRRVHLVASLPCYLEVNVDKQRGRHVYQESIEVIRRLNAVGYGITKELPLDLVYNPGTAALPPDQAALEQDYRRELGRQFGIGFTRLLTITNMAIGRFLHDLHRLGKAEGYQQLLRDSFNPATLAGLMCRHQLHVGWDGTMFDCDFNFALGEPVGVAHQHIRDFDPETFLSRTIATGEHCFGCTAGHGSSCGGSLA